MAFVKGTPKPKNSGRKPGQENKATVEFKQALTNLLEYAAPEMIGWLKQVAETDPNKALDHVSKLAEYVQPKLARTEMTGKDGGAIETKTNLSESDRAILNQFVNQSRK